MQPETHFAASLGEQSAFSEQAISISEKPRPQPVSKTIPPKSKITRREAKFDAVSTAIVVGGTAQFVTFIFGLVTELGARVSINILLSAFIGLCIGGVAYVLMKEND